MLSSNARQELMDLLSDPSIVGPDGVPPGASEFDIQTFESESLHRLRLPPTLRDWFSVVNGAFCGTQGFLGLNGNRVDRKYFLARSWLPVADVRGLLLDRPNWSGPRGLPRFLLGP